MGTRTNREPHDGDEATLPGTGGTWAMVLAGGEGSRLHPVAQHLYGYPRPKQFCDFGAGASLLELTLRRAEELTRADCIVISGASHHAREWDRFATERPGVRVVQQPKNAGTAPGILLPLLAILEEDPDAVVHILPSDHHVSDSATFVRRLAEAERLVRAAPQQVVLLGAAAPEDANGYGWIVPCPAEDRTWNGVQTFREKPPGPAVRSLVAEGALVNTFVMVAKASALARLVRAGAPGWWRALTTAWGDDGMVARAYDTLPPADFSRDILEANVDHLRVMSLGSVGWSDVGTPERLAAIWPGSQLPALAAV